MKKYYIPFVFFIIASISCLAQKYLYFESYNIDSLLNILPDQVSEDRVNTLNKLGITLSYQNAILSKQYADEALQLAREINYEEGMADAMLNFGYIYQFDGNFPQALNNYFAALELYEKLGMKRSVGKVYHSIAYIHYLVRNYYKTVEYSYKALEVFREQTEEGITMGSARDTMMVYSGLGLINFLIGKCDESVKQTLQYLDVGKKNHFGETDMLLHTILAGERFNCSGEKDSAVIYLIKALNYPDVNPSIEALKIRAIISLGHLHYSEGVNDSAVVYYRRAYEKYNEKGFIYWAMTVSNWLGFVFYENNDLNNAEKYFLQSEKIFDELLAKRSWYRHDSLKRITTFGFELFFPMCPMQMSRMMWTAGMTMYNMLYKINEVKNKTGEAFKYHIAFSNAQDTVNKLQRNRETVELQTKYESERKDQQIINLSKENEYQDIQISQSRIILSGLLGLVILIIILAIVLIRQNKLREQQKNILLQQRLLRSQMNPHFIFNSLTSIQNFILKQDSIKASDYLSKFSDLVRNILENSTQEIVEFEKEIRTIENYLELQKVRFKDKFEYSVDIDKTIDPETSNIPPMLLQPFLENSIEHGFKNKKEKGYIRVRFTSKNNIMYVELEDNGIGREMAQEIMLKQNKDHMSLATEITRERIHILNKKLKKKIVLNIQDLKDEKNQPIGTRVVFEIPCLS